ncbi:MAG: NAD(P)-dependent oxidoreductase [Spirochaetia bacterium]
MNTVVVFATSFLDKPIALRDTGPSGPTILARLADESDVTVEYRCDRDPTQAVAAEELDGVTAVIADIERYDADLLKQVGPRGGGSLHLITRYGVGYDSVDVAAATEAGIIVANTPGANSRPTAEWAVATIMAVAGRRLIHHRRASQGLRKVGPSRIDISGKTLGVVGTGAVGRIVVDLLAGFNVSVLACDPYPNAEWANRAGARYVELNELLAGSEIVTLHAASNVRIVGPTELSLMRPSTFLVNCARGVLVDNAAAWRAVKDGELWGYGLDEIWPHPELPLDDLNIVTSPHVGSDTEIGKSNMQRMSADSIAAFVRTGQPPHVVNPEVLAAR